MRSIAINFSCRADATKKQIQATIHKYTYGQISTDINTRAHREHTQHHHDHHHRRRRRHCQDPRINCVRSRNVQLQRRNGL